MADNVPITAGTGTDIATDDCGAGGHVQVVKLAISTDGSATLIPAEATNGLDVDVTRVQGTVAVSGAQVLGTDTYTETTSVGVTMGAVRRDADTTLVGTTNEFGPLQMDANGRLKVEAFSGETLPVGGDIAHDTGDAGNPVKVGGVAVSGSATPTSVAAADRVRWIFNQHGIPYVLGGHPNLITREYDFGTGAQTDVNLAAAVVAADERVYVTRFEALCDNANTVAVSVRVGFGTASVPAASASGVSGMIASHPGIAPGSGIICGNGAGILAVGGAGEEPRLTSSAATSGNLHVVITYFLVDETP